MRARTGVIAVLGLALSVAACGDDGKTASTTTTAATTTAAATTTTKAATTTSLSVADLQKKLLAVGDLPAGWDLGEPINQADLHDSVQSPCQSVTLDPTVAAQLKAVTGIQFQPSDNGTRHFIEFVTTGDAAGLANAFEAYVATVQSCSTVTSTTTATTVLTIEPLTLPSIGDQRAGWAYRGKETPDAQAVWFSRSAFVRVGGIVVSLGLTEILSTPDQQPTVTDAQFVTVVQAAAAKFGA